LPEFTRQHPRGMFIPFHFRPIIANLRKLYSDRLELLSVDDEWLNFRIRGLTETPLILDLQERPEALLGPEWRNFQVVTPLNARRADGLSIRWCGLASLAQNNNIKPGFWFS